MRPESGLGKGAMLENIRSRFSLRFNRCLVHRHLPLGLAAIAFLLASVSITTGLQFDDYFHQMQFQHPEHFPDPIATLFSFAVTTPFENDVYMQQGMMPWWTYEGLSIRFFRPLAAATHWLDYRLWPQSPAAMHVHSLVWFAGLVFAAALMYRKTGPSAWVAGLAALLFAIDDAHGMPAGWIANRNALMAGLFGFCCLYYHIRWRREGWSTGAALSSIGFILGLLCGESAVAAGAYLLSYELFLSPDHWRKRITAVLPCAVIVMIWWIVYRTAGFGAHGSGAYIDPGRDPAAFLGMLMERIPLLLYGQWLFPDISLYGFLSRSMAFIALIVIYILLAGILIVFIPLLKRDAVSRFWALGMVLSLLPFAATSPADRLLIIPGLGAMGLLAQLLAAWKEKPVWLPAIGLRCRLTHGFVVVVIIIHGIIAPLTLPLHSLSVAMATRKILEEPVMALSKGVNLQDKTLVLINPPIPMLMTYLPFICEKLGLAVPRQSRVLATGLTSELDIRRADVRTLEIELEEGFIGQEMDRLFRGMETPMRIGQQVDLGDMRAEVLSLTSQQRPLRVRFTFDKDLEDPSMVFYVWKGGQCEPFTLPGPGQSVRVEPLIAMQ